MRKIIYSLIFSFIILLGIGVKEIRASEGIFELSSTTNERYRCFAVSVLTPDNQYHIVVTCRNLIYPPDSDIYKYILWARSGKVTTRLGSLGVGKATFNTKDAFNQLFVTLEKNEKVNTPGLKMVMWGDLKRISFLDGSDNATIQPTQVAQQNQVVPTGTPLTTKDKLLIGLKRSGIIAGAALVGLIGLIFVVTRSRG